MSIFRDLRIISNNINSMTIGPRYSITGIDNHNNLHIMQLLSADDTYVRMYSHQHDTEYEIFRYNLDNEQNTLLNEIYGTQYGNSNIDNNWQIFIDSIMNAYTEYNWGDNINNRNDFDSPVKCVMSRKNFKERCGIETSKNKFTFRKWGPPVVESLGVTDPTCSICLLNIEKWDKVAITPCNHVFHKSCAEKWFCEECVHPTCPTCRTDIR